MRAKKNKKGQNVASLSLSKQGSIAVPTEKKESDVIEAISMTSLSKDKQVKITPERIIDPQSPNLHKQQSQQEHLQPKEDIPKPPSILH